MGMLENMSKGFVQGLEKDVQALDPEHTGHPALAGALESIREGEAALAPFLAKINWLALVERLLPELAPADIAALVKGATALFAGLKLIFKIAAELYKKRFV